MANYKYDTNKKTTRSSNTPFPGCYDRSFYDRHGIYHSYYTTDKDFGTSGILEFNTIVSLIFFTCILFFVIKITINQHIIEREKIVGDSSQICITDNIDIFTDSEETELTELLQEIYTKSGIAVTIYTDNLEWQDKYANIEKYCQRLHYDLGNSKNDLLLLCTTDLSETNPTYEYDFICGKETSTCLTDDLLIRLEEYLGKALYGGMSLSDAINASFASIMDELAETTIDWSFISAVLIELLFFSFLFTFVFADLIADFISKKQEAYRYFKKHPERISFSPMVLLNSCPNCGASNSAQSETCSYCGSSLKLSDKKIKYTSPSPKKNTFSYHDRENMLKGSKKIKTSKIPFQGCYDRSYYSLFGKYHRIYTNDKDFGTTSGLNFFIVMILAFFLFVAIGAISGTINTAFTYREKIDGNSSRILIADNIDVLTESEEAEILEVLQEVYNKSGIAVTVYTDDFDWHNTYDHIESYSKRLYYSIGVDETGLLLFYSTDPDADFFRCDFDFYYGDDTTAWATYQLKDKLWDNFTQKLSGSNLGEAIHSSFASILEDLTIFAVNSDFMPLFMPTLLFVVLFMGSFGCLLFVAFIDVKQISAHRYFKKHPDQLSYEPLFFHSTCPSCGASNPAHGKTCPFCNTLLIITDKDKKYVSPNS